MERDLRAFAAQRTWRWRPDPNDPDHYLAVETTERGLRYFAWSHVDDDGVTREATQTFAELERDGPAWALPDEIERAVRAWVAQHRALSHSSGT